jgi:hypothetical protein
VTVLAKLSKILKAKLYNRKEKDMKKVLHRAGLFLKHILAIFVDLLFPVLDLLEALLLVVPVPQAKKIVDELEKLELQLIHWVNVLKEVKGVVEQTHDKLTK